MSYAEEFATVDAILGCDVETLGVDAFALSLIKAERQMRKLFTHLAFQSPEFDYGDILPLRSSLAKNRNVYFSGFIAGWDALYSRSVGDLVGAEYARLHNRIQEAIQHRNKIFHGQLTERFLFRSDLLAYVLDIRTWCSGLATNSLAEVGYDGFGRISFQKSTRLDVVGRLKVRMRSVAEYEAFIHDIMER
ncbi:MAG: hypothetical protein HY708_02580 [Ignavibacteriae bacterium]|nr:hypothetical protein [Ignavibacteriota bacterium]